MSTKIWNYYNFDNNWNEFYSIWRSEKIQNILKNDIENDIYKNWYQYNNWKVNDPIWYLSISNYWYNKIINKIDKDIEKYDMINIYKKRLINIGFNKNIKNIDDYIYNKIQNNLWFDYIPKKNTIDSLIIVNGNNVINNTLYEIAKILFPTSIIINDYDLILVYNNNNKYVFDLLDYYLTTYDGEDLLYDDEYYDNIIKEHNNYFIEENDYDL